MASFGFAMRSHNEYLGYHGNFDEAATACFKTAVVFLAISGISFVAFVGGAVRTKLSPPAANGRTDYTAV